jgi:hypothetical protein
MDKLSHGYAPKSSATPPSPDPLKDVVGDVVHNVAASARAELRLLEARAAMAQHGVQRAGIWGFVAASALLVALFALAFGAILILALYVGPLLATLGVFAGLLLLAAFAGYRARQNALSVSEAFRSDAFANSLEGEDE